MAGVSLNGNFITPSPASSARRGAPSERGGFYSGRYSELIAFTENRTQSAFLAFKALMGNHVAAVWADYPTVVSQLQSGTLRGLVTTSHARIETLPDVPTLGETGVSKYEAEILE